MPSHRVRTWALVVAGACVSAGAILGGGVAVAQSPAPTPFPAGAVVLAGTITGTNSGIWEEIPRTDVETSVAMDVTFVLEPHRGRASGTAEVSGTYTGDCAFSDSASVPVDWDTEPDPDLTFAPHEGRPAFAHVEVYTTDPRYAERPMTGMYLSVGAAGGGEGGTCGYLTGKTYPITDVDFPLRVDVLGCSMLEVLSQGGRWSGSCEEADPSGGGISRSWEVELVELQH